MGTFTTVMSHLLVSIIGPTAIGKTAKSITLAQAFDTEIISADSRQFFKEMRIGTAVPSVEELTAVPHHFIQHISVDDAYDVGDFEQEALQVLEDLYKKHQVVFMVGGSGLYVDAVSKGLDYFPPVSPEVRAQLNAEVAAGNLQALQEELKLVDPNYAAQVELKNPRRLVRALEVYRSSGQPYSSFLNQPKPQRPFKTLKVGLKASRELVYNRIERRVDIMIEQGLLAEAKSLYPQRYKNALNTIGYKELYRYFDGEWTLDFAIAEIKKNTRRFAKRQLTWFRKDENITWFDYACDPSEIENFIRLQMKR